MNTTPHDNLARAIGEARFGTDREILDGFVQPGDEWFIDSKEHTTYTWYRAIARVLAPKRILEFGVRYGYSAMALLSGARQGGVRFPEYIGIDGECDGLETNDIAARNIRKSGAMSGRIIRENTNLTDRIDKILGSPRFDLVHIDCDHSEYGITREIEMALRHLSLQKSAAIVMDDCDVSHIKDAATRIALEWKIQPIFIPTIHTLGVLIRSCGG